MEFSNWFESNIDKTVSLWKSLKVKVPVNEKGINEFANILSSPQFSAVRLLFTETGQSANWLPAHLYDAPITETLLNTRSKILKDAKGTINLPEEGSKFLFCMSEDTESKATCDDEVFGNVPVGSIIIRFPPTNIDNNGKTLLKSIIRHEVTHAHDWNDKMFREENPIPSNKEAFFDISKYHSNLYEARALVSQLNYLLRQIGKEKVPEIIQLLKHNSLTSGIMPLMPYIESYLNSFSGYSAYENVFDKNSDETKLKIEGIADLIIKSVTLMKFSNFARL